MKDPTALLLEKSLWTYPKPQVERSSPEETALCHCPMVCRGIYIYRENIFIMSVNSLSQKSPITFLRMTQTVHKVWISQLMGLNFTHGSFFPVAICTWALQASANGDTSTCQVTWQLYELTPSNFILNNCAPSNKILLVSHSDRPEKKKLQPTKDKEHQKCFFFSLLFIFYLIACSNVSKDPYLFEPSFPGGKPWQKLHRQCRAPQETGQEPWKQSKAAKQLLWAAG